MAKRLSEYDRGLAVGMGLAGAIIMSISRNTSVVREMLDSAALNRAKLKRLGLEAYDLKNLSPVFKEQRQISRRIVARNRSRATYVRSERARKWKHVFFLRSWHHRDRELEWLRDQMVPDMWIAEQGRIKICEDKLALGFKLRWC